MTELHISFYLAPLLCVYFAVSFAALARQAGGPPRRAPPCASSGAASARRRERRLPPLGASRHHRPLVRQRRSDAQERPGLPVRSSATCSCGAPTRRRTSTPDTPRCFSPSGGILQRRPRDRPRAGGRRRPAAPLLLGRALRARVPARPRHHARGAGFLSRLAACARAVPGLLPHPEQDPLPRPPRPVRPVRLRAAGHSVARGDPRARRVPPRVPRARGLPPKRPIGISILRGMDRVYETVRREAQETPPRSADLAGRLRVERDLRILRHAHRRADRERLQPGTPPALRDGGVRAARVSTSASCRRRSTPCCGTGTSRTSSSTRTCSPQGEPLPVPLHPAQPSRLAVPPVRDAGRPQPPL